MSTMQHFAKRAEEIAAEILAADITVDSTITLIYQLEDDKGNRLPEIRNEIASHRPSAAERQGTRNVARLLLQTSGNASPTEAEIDEMIRLQDSSFKFRSKEGYAELAKHMVRTTQVGFLETIGDVRQVVRIVDISVEITHLGPLP
jgi:hypothetical protein